MSNVAVQIANGQIVDSTSNAKATSAVSTAESTIDSDTFLTLLVAEMQYQDPLEPTSNTEWVSQYATFTQVEQMNDLTAQMNQSYASSLVGQEVIVIDDTAASGYTSGKVDYVYMENNTPYLAVGSNLFTLDKVDSVVDSDYLDAVTVSSTFSSMIDALPNVKSLSKADKSLLEAARSAYDSMTDYQKRYVDAEDLKTLTDLESAYKAAYSEQDEADTVADDTDSAVSDTDDATADAESV